jgi:hypothetical protein
VEKTMANTVKTTKRDRFEEIKTLCELVGETDRVDVEGIVAFCDKEIETLDSRAEKARARAAEKRAAGDELQTAVFEVLTDEPATRDEIAARLDPSFDASVAKVGFRLTALVKNGQAVKEEATITKEDGKSHRVNVYKLA